MQKPTAITDREYTLKCKFEIKSEAEQTGTLIGRWKLATCIKRLCAFLSTLFHEECRPIVGKTWKRYSSWQSSWGTYGHLAIKNSWPKLQDEFFHHLNRGGNVRSMPNESYSPPLWELPLVQILRTIVWLRTCPATSQNKKDETLMLQSITACFDGASYYPPKGPARH